MKKRTVLFMLFVSCVTPLSAQLPPGGGAPGGTPAPPIDCPYQFVMWDGFNYIYNTKSCVNGATGQAASPTEITNLQNPACDSMTQTCNNPNVGNAGTPPSTEQTPPKPLRSVLDAEPPAYQEWDAVKRNFINVNLPCVSGFTNIDSVRAFAKSTFKGSKDTAESLDALRAYVPTVVTQYKNAQTAAQQDAILTDFNRRLAQVLSVGVETRVNFTNKFRLLDLPAQEEFPSEIDEGPEDAGIGVKKDAGVVKIVEGQQVFYFKIVETTVPAPDNYVGVIPPPAVIRSGFQTEEPDDTSAVKTGTFDGNNLWTHRIKVDGKTFLVTSKDERQASKP